MKRLVRWLAAPFAALALASIMLATGPVPSPARAQSPAQRTAVLSVTVDVDAQAWATTVRSAGAAVSAAQLQRVSTLNRCLKATTVWYSLDRLWPLASENATQALTDLKARAVATAVNSPTFTASQGYAGNGTSSYINTNFVASTDGVNYTLNSAHLALYNRTARTDKAGGHRNAGAYGAGGVSSQINLFSFNHLFDSVIHGALIQVDAGFADAAGMFAINRSASNASQSYRNSASIGTSSTASDGVPSSKLYVGAVNNSEVGGSSPIAFVTDQHAMVSVGGSLDATKQAAFSLCFNGGYMTSLGTNVY